MTTESKLETFARGFAGPFAIAPFPRHYANASQNTSAVLYYYSNWWMHACGNLMAVFTDGDTARGRPEKPGEAPEFPPEPFRGFGNNGGQITVSRTAERTEAWGRTEEKKRAGASRTSSRGSPRKNPTPMKWKYLARCFPSLYPVTLRCGLYANTSEGRDIKRGIKNWSSL